MGDANSDSHINKLAICPEVIATREIATPGKEPFLLNLKEGTVFCDMNHTQFV
ncbi:hypothetical protein SAMN05444280_11088 [Tangfeifania diversioriginum]|uniref:Uncharacterized protein n=1 Tax=Tangfeifania diversioriginum TaxID=1168035 RepID=A0A1M6GA38_9BACT|nr:hypothetical protein SAMN05444280_11088 [Tangfeifania diversioriginum]